jgi:hypothetical protein
MAKELIKSERNIRMVRKTTGTMAYKTISDKILKMPTKSHETVPLTL